MTTIPYQRGSATSKAAAEGQRSKVKRDIQRIYDLLLAQPDNRGMTTDEIRQALGMLASTAGARRRDLEQLGGCVKRQERRRTSAGSMAYVYSAVPGADLSGPKKVGRPKKRNKNDVKLTFYVTPWLEAALLEACQEQGTSLSVYVRNLLHSQMQERIKVIAWKAEMEQRRAMAEAMDILGGE